MNDEGARFNANVAELLSIQAARLTNLNGTPPVALLSFRMNPSDSWSHENIAITQEQCLRLRNDLHRLLTDSDSWLHSDEAHDWDDSFFLDESV